VDFLFEGSGPRARFSCFSGQNTVEWRYSLRCLIHVILNVFQGLVGDAGDSKMNSE
jgi:hypothetical protein